MKTRYGLIALGAASVLLPPMSLAESELDLGLWANYQYLPDNKANRNAWGEIGGEALIVSVDGEAEEDEGNWSYAAEIRFGPGSFTDPDNNSTGDRFAVHEAWVGWQLNEHDKVFVGKSQLPFGWVTINFWPGDILLAGYGDQMDVGVKLSGERKPFGYSAAFYLADDWGSTSTDTLDDNRHWGSSNTYRKVRTWVGDLSYAFTDHHSLGLSLQTGRLQDLTGTPDKPVDGRHDAAVLYYQGTVGSFFAKASFIDAQREFPEAYRLGTGISREVENRRFALEVGYRQNDWTFYLDASSAHSDTEKNPEESIYSLVPGFSYDYGPGKIYAEYLWQDGNIDRDGLIQGGNFDALYLTIDFYR